MDSRRSDKNEPRDPVSLASHTRDPEFQVRRLARVLVGRLDQTSNVLSGDARPSQSMIDSQAPRLRDRPELLPSVHPVHGVYMRTCYNPNDIAELYGGFSAPLAHVLGVFGVQGCCSQVDREER